MVEVTVDSIRASLMSQHRVVVLKDKGSDRYLPIWVDPAVAEAITVELQGISPSRPMTHDLLRNVIEDLGASVDSVVVTDVRSDIFIATIFLSVNGKTVAVDSRPSDAIALAVRTGCNIYVDDKVMESSSVVPEPGIPLEGETGEDNLAPYREFLESLDIDSLSKEDDEDK
jgi:hypothetical protein